MGKHAFQLIIKAFELRLFGGTCNLKKLLREKGKLKTEV